MNWTLYQRTERNAFQNLERHELRELSSLAANESFFIFHPQLYWHIEGITMVPIGSSTCKHMFMLFS